ncbi:MAG: DNA polymerase sliding clamp, partial [Halobacteria archaeon]|nr:DNA polymerase sliding clamp [Halobacteria archaeon]
MFKSVINAGTLKSTVDSINVLVDECKIHLDDDGVHIKAVDPANVGMVELDLPDDEFEEYEADGETIGVNLTRLKDIIGMGKSGDSIELELDEETNKLKIRIDGLRYTLSLINPDSVRKEPNVPDLDLSAEVVVAGREIKRGIKAAGMVSDHMAFGVEDGAFFMHAEGDTDDVHVDLDEEDVVAIEGGDARSLFSLDYLDSMGKAIPNDAQVTLEIGVDYPVKM